MRLLLLCTASTAISLLSIAGIAWLFSGEGEAAEPATPPRVIVTSDDATAEVTSGVTLEWRLPAPELTSGVEVDCYPADEPRASDLTDDERAALFDEIETLNLSLERLSSATATPYAAFLASHDADGTTQDERDSVRYMLEETPVFLRPGEAAWILARHECGDWKDHGPTRQIALIQYLGPHRVLDEASPEFLSVLRADYDDAEWWEIFGSPRPAK